MRQNRLRENLIGFQTIVNREMKRVLRIWVQTLVPPVITATLYFIIFGRLIGSRVGAMGNFSYIDYIAPGLIMMQVITSAYANVVSSFFGAKFGSHRRANGLAATQQLHHHGLRHRRRAARPPGGSAGDDRGA